MSRENFKRNKAKIYRKLRWYYMQVFQEKKRHLFLYRSYRNLLRHKKMVGIWDEIIGGQDFYMTKEVHPGAGIGDQLASWITGYYYAGYFKLQYSYSGFFPDKWENFFDFGAGETKTKDLIKQGYHKVILPFFNEKNKCDIDLIQNIIASYAGKKIVFFLEINQIYSAQYGVMDTLRTKFNLRHSIEGEKLVFHANRINIAIHIRRGDITVGQITGERELTKRWMDNSYYHEILNTILPLLEGKKVEIYLFSQGTRMEFQDFEQYANMHYCIDMSAADSFLHLVRAQILITSKSSFSYKPALMAEGIRICPKDFWHEYPNSPEWILADNQGKIEEEKFIKAVCFCNL